MGANYGNWGPVAERVADRARRLGFPVRASTVHQWIHSSTTLRPADRVALIVEVCAELEVLPLQAHVLAPIRDAESNASVRSPESAHNEWREASALVDYLAKHPAVNTKTMVSTLSWAAAAALSYRRALLAGRPE